MAPRGMFHCFLYIAPLILGSFNAASPPIYNQDFVITPEDPDSGRGNNQGLEGLTASPDGKYLYSLLQSATLVEQQAMQVQY